MKLRHVWLAALAAGLSVRAEASLLDRLFPPNDLQTITVTDVTDAGRSKPQPSAGHPVYYAAVSAGFRDFGGIRGGDRPIDRHLVNSTVLKALAKQGYLPADDHHKPEVVLVWMWGTMYTEMLPLNFGLTRQVNRGQLLRFLGGEKVGLLNRDSAFDGETLSPGLLFQTGDAANLLDAASDDLYVAAICAYDVKLSDPKHAVLLWRTKISSPARGMWLPDAFPAMMAIAAPYIGRETEKPVWVRATDKFRPNIKVGDPKVVSYLEASVSKVTDVGRSK